MQKDNGVKVLRIRRMWRWGDDRREGSEETMGE